MKDKINYIQRNSNFSAEEISNLSQKEIDFLYELYLQKSDLEEI